MVGSVQQDSRRRVHQLDVHRTAVGEAVGDRVQGRGGVRRRHRRVLRPRRGGRPAGDWGRLETTAHAGACWSAVPAGAARGRARRRPAGRARTRSWLRRARLRGRAGRPGRAARRRAPASGPRSAPARRPTPQTVRDATAALGRSAWRPSRAGSAPRSPRRPARRSPASPALTGQRGRPIASTSPPPLAHAVGDHGHSGAAELRCDVLVADRRRRLTARPPRRRRTRTRRAPRVSWARVHARFGGNTARSGDGQHDEPQPRVHRTAAAASRCGSVRSTLGAAAATRRRRREQLRRPGPRTSGRTAPRSSAGRRR